MAQMVKNLPAMPETKVQSLGWKDPPENGMATHSSILVWRISWTEEPGGLQSTGSQTAGYDRATSTLTLLFFTCLEPHCPEYTYKTGKEVGIPDHLTCLLRNLYTGQEATVRTGHGSTDWFQIGKGVRQGCILSPCLFNLYAEYIMRNAGLDEAQAGIRLLGEITITSDM